MFFEAVYVLFLILSVICAVSVPLAAIARARSGNAPGIVKMIVGVFMAIFLICLPINLLSPDNCGIADIPRILLVTVHEVIQIFVANIDTSYIYEAVSELDSKILRISYSTVGTLLFVLAPMLTFGAVLSFFRNFFDDVGYVLCRRKPLFIFSELNERSLTLAKNIYEKHLRDKVQPMIVFTGVMPEGEDKMSGAKDIHAVLLGKDIVQLDFAAKKKDTEIFLIGDDESENVRKAAIITDRLNSNGKKLNVRVFVFACKESSRYVLDSLRYENLLNMQTLTPNGDNLFKIRRVDTIKQLAWNNVPDMRIMERADDGVISIMIVGMGQQGMEFFKMLMWFCQIDGIKLEINLVDKAHKDENGGIESRIARQCPEIIEKNGAEYDIEIFDGIDPDTDSFEKLLFGGGEKTERLKRTDIIIVSMGDDDLDIETSVYLRQLFDKCSGVGMTDNDTDRTLEQERPDIYSIVYDSKKSGIVSGAEKAEYLINHKEQKYHIRFIGSIDEQFSYDNIFNAEKEAAAFKCHAEWSGAESDVTDKIREKRLLFDRFEFYRLSSLASVLHQEFLNSSGVNDRLKCLTSGNDGEKECENCYKRRKMEHERWEAYMRTEGFTYRKERFDRAKLHNDLTEFDRLSKDEQEKDALMIGRR